MKDTVVCGVIRDDRQRILVVDKYKQDGRVLTILPGGKIDTGETPEQALKREIDEELGVQLTSIGERIGELLGLPSPTNGVKRDIQVFPAELDNNQRIDTQAEVGNARFLSQSEILALDTTTEITKNIIGIL